MTENLQAPGVSPLPVPDALIQRALPRPETTDETPELAALGSEPTNSPLGDVDKRLAFAEQTHQYIRDYIRQADQKAAVFIAASTALLALLYKGGISSRWLRPPSEWNMLDLAAFIAMFALGLSSIVALAVVIPRTPGSRRGYVFWEAIAEYAGSRDYADDLARVSIPTLLQAKFEHCSDLARVCREKYWFLRLALWIGALGLVASIAVLLFAQPTA